LFKTRTVWGCWSIRTFFFVVLSLCLFMMTACTPDTKQENRSHEGEVVSKEENDHEEQTESAGRHKSEAVDKRQVIAKHLQEPWEIALVGNTFYISERNGSIVTVTMNDDVQTRKPVRFEKDLSHQPEAGLLGIAFPSDFQETKTAFAYYSYQENGAFFQRVVTIKESHDHWEETSVLLDKIPGGRYHQGGRIEIGPDQKLYVTTGDAAKPELSQELDSLAGKILRMNLDGSIPDDNPFGESYVYSYGHRNPQGLAWNSDHELYATEHGSNAYDEINKIEAGKNYGWPVIRGDEAANGMASPVLHSGEGTWAPSGMTYFAGYFYFASLRGESVRKFDPVNKTEEIIVSDVGRVRDVLATNEGLYIITNNTDGRGTPSKHDDQLIFIPLT